MHCAAHLRSTHPVTADTGSDSSNLLLHKEVIKMGDFEGYLFEALEQVQAWEMPEEDIPAAANAQALLMAGCCPDYYYDGVLSEYPSLR
jgi:hypothetical protein